MDGGPWHLMRHQRARWALVHGSNISSIAERFSQAACQDRNFGTQGIQVSGHRKLGIVRLAGNIAANASRLSWKSQ